jgi:hypothetical protein
MWLFDISMIDGVYPHTRIQEVGYTVTAQSGEYGEAGGDGKESAGNS